MSVMHQVELEKAKDSTSAKKSELMATEDAFWHACRRNKPGSVVFIRFMHLLAEYLLCMHVLHVDVGLRRSTSPHCTSARAGEVDSLKAAKADRAYNFMQ
eukprot:6323884-Amphidinium_carterae.1